MADLSNLKIANTYSRLLQVDTDTNQLQNGVGSNPTAITFNGTTLKYVDGSQQNGYVLISDAAGNASWGAVEFSGDVYISGGSVNGTIIELNTTSGNTVSIPGLNWSASTTGNISNSGLTGNVGIGTSTPNAKLTVAGTISGETINGTTIEGSIDGGTF